MIAVPSSAQYTWQEAERSMFIHFGPATWQGQEYDDGSVPVEQMHPEALDTGQWCRAALAFGAKRIVFVAKHTGGFCWWQTDTTEYSVKNCPWKNGKGDVLEELARSCREYGLRLGIYIYPGDRRWGAYIGGGGKTKNPSLQEAYDQVFRRQLQEVLSGYGAIEEVWFDGSCLIEVGDLLERYAKESVIFQGKYATIRWCGTERGMLPDTAWSTIDRDILATGTATVVQSDPKGDTWAPLEVDTPLYDHYWFWSPENARKLKSLSELMRIYYHSAGRGGVLLLNVSPNTDGLIPAADVQRLEEFGKEIDRRFGHPLVETSGEGYSITLEFETAPQKVNHVVLMEDYRLGERVREYRVEAGKQGEWVQIASGCQIGRKRILVFETAQKAVSLVYDPTTDSWRTPGDGVKVLEWSADEIEGRRFSFETDISHVVTEPGQYELLFAVEGAEGVQVDSLQVLLEGEVTDGVLSPEEVNRRYHLTRTSAVENSGGGKTGLRGSIRCPGTGQRGTLTVKRMI